MCFKKNAGTNLTNAKLFRQLLVSSLPRKCFFHLEVGKMERTYSRGESTVNYSSIKKTGSVLGGSTYRGRQTECTSSLCLNQMEKFLALIWNRIFPRHACSQRKRTITFDGIVEGAMISHELNIKKGE